MSDQKDKSKDKNNVRISENDIKRKLYGEQWQAKAKEPLLKGKISEDAIKNKLYGAVQSQKDAVINPEPAVNNDLFSAKKIEHVKQEQAKQEQVKLEQAKLEQVKLEQQLKAEQAKLEKIKLEQQFKLEQGKLEQAKIEQQFKIEQTKITQAKLEQAKLEQIKREHAKAEMEKAAAQKSVPVKQDVKILSAYQEEISQLKLEIKNLEGKLQRTELQKDKSKVNPVQKKQLISIREVLASLVLNKIPKKFILLGLGGIIIFLLIISVLFKPKQGIDELSKSEPKLTRIVKSENPVESKPSKQTESAPVQRTVEPTKPQTNTDTRKYTIQVAEYADEQAAMNFVKELESQKFEVFLTSLYRGENNTRPYFKINVGSFNSFNEAKQFNVKFREKTNINDSFIREIK